MFNLAVGFYTFLFKFLIFNVFIYNNTELKTDVNSDFIHSLHCSADQEEEGGRNGFPGASHPTRKSYSLDIGTE